MELRVYDSWILNKFFDPMNQKFVKPSFFMNGFFWNMILLLFISTLQYLTNPYQFTIAYIVFVFLLIFIIKVREFFCLKSSRRSVITLLKLYKLFQKFFFFFKSYYYFSRSYFCKGNFKIVSLTNLFQLFIYL